MRELRHQKQLTAELEGLSKAAKLREDEEHKLEKGKHQMNDMGDAARNILSKYT
jgi:hypothetical protein